MDNPGDFQTITYETVSPAVARIMLDRPEVANAQNARMLYELNSAFDVAVADDDVKVIVLGANGKRAKELLFTGEAMGAAEARSVGMVNRVVPREDLEAETLALAEKIAARPSMGLKLAKMSVNQSVDAMGFPVAIQSAFGKQHVGHAHNQWIHGTTVDPNGAEVIRREAR